MRKLLLLIPLLLTSCAILDEESSESATSVMVSKDRVVKSLYHDCYWRFYEDNGIHPYYLVRTEVDNKGNYSGEYKVEMKDFVVAYYSGYKEWGNTLYIYEDNSNMFIVYRS